MCIRQVVAKMTRVPLGIVRVGKLVISPTELAVRGVLVVIPRVLDFIKHVSITRV